MPNVDVEQHKSEKEVKEIPTFPWCISAGWLCWSSFVIKRKNTYEKNYLHVQRNAVFEGDEQEQERGKVARSSRPKQGIHPWNQSVR